MRIVTLAIKNKMRIHVHTRIKNEERMLPYFLRHYEKFCKKIFIRVEPSIDKTLEIAKRHPKVVLIEPTFEYSGDKNLYNIKDLMQHRNSGWKEYSTPNNCDWVIIVDCDEFLYHKNIIQLLKVYDRRGITFPRVIGYQMYSNSGPTTNKQIYDELKNGFPMIEYSKRVIMKPFISPNYSDGCHSHNAGPKEKIVESKKTKLKLFHYSRQIFGKEELFDFWKKRMLSVSNENSPNDINNMDKHLLDSLYNLYDLTIKSYLRYINVKDDQEYNRFVPLYEVKE